MPTRSDTVAGDPYVFPERIVHNDKRFRKNFRVPKPQEDPGKH